MKSKFKFAFNTLLKVRERQEELTRRDYLEAKSNLDFVIQQIKKMYARIDECKLRIGQIEAQNQMSINEVVQIHHFIAGQNKKIEAARLKSRELMSIAEEKHHFMVEASRQKKIIEKLKDKKHEAFKQELLRKENKATDDMTTMRFRGGSQK